MERFIMDLNQLLLVAFLVESLIQTIKPIYDKDRGWNRDVIIALIVSIALCALIKIDLFALVGLQIYFPNEQVGTYIGSALTGIIASRGSNLAHDLLKYVETASNRNVSGPVG